MTISSDLDPTVAAMQEELAQLRAEVDAWRKRYEKGQVREIAYTNSEKEVAPVYTAYLRIVGAYGETPDPDTLSDAERAVFEQWQAAETAAVAAAFGPNRYMGDAMYEIAL